LASCWREKLVERVKDLHSQITRNKNLYPKEKRAFGIEVLEQVTEILTGVTTVEEIAEIEKAIQEIRGKLPVEQREGFWVGKTPCWEMFQCPVDVKNKCPAFKYRYQPCWEMEGTYCKLFDYKEKGDGVDICQYCRVYKRWGNSEPIEIEVHEEGLHAIG
jgi:hypothetical protein